MERPEDIVERIDAWFETDRRMSEEDKLLDGLEWAKSHGFLDELECEEVLRLFHQRNLAPPDS